MLLLVLSSASPLLRFLCPVTFAILCPVIRGRDCYLHRPIWLSPYMMIRSRVTRNPYPNLDPGFWRVLFAGRCPLLIVRVKIYKYLHSINFSDFFYSFCLHSPSNRSRVSFVFLVHASHNFFRSCSLYQHEI